MKRKVILRESKIDLDVSDRKSLRIGDVEIDYDEDFVFVHLYKRSKVVFTSTYEWQDCERYLLIDEDKGQISFLDKKNIARIVCYFTREVF